VNREGLSRQLRSWADQAQREAQEADTEADRLNWEGQAQVLGGVSTFLTGPGREMADANIWQQVVGDRSQALLSWEKVQEGPEAMLYAGVVAGYDLVLTTLRDMTGKTWEDINARTGWVNR
jgi:hypothetical protein